MQGKRLEKHAILTEGKIKSLLQILKSVPSLEDRAKMLRSQLKLEISSGSEK